MIFDPPRNYDNDGGRNDDCFEAVQLLNIDDLTNTKTSIDVKFNNASIDIFVFVD